MYEWRNKSERAGRRCNTVWSVDKWMAAEQRRQGQASMVCWLWGARTRTCYYTIAPSANSRLGEP